MNSIGQVRAYPRLSLPTFQARLFNASNAIFDFFFQEGGVSGVLKNFLGAPL